MNKKGFVTIETVIVCSFALIMLITFISMFAYIYPAISIQREVFALGKTAERNGGLTSENIENFKRSISEYSFVKNSNKPIEIKAYTIPSGRSALNVDDNTYIHRNSNEVIKIEVWVPSNVMLGKLVGKLNGYYYFRTVVLSEKY